MKTTKYILMIIVLAMLPIASRAQLLTLKSNLAFDALAIPNIGAEMATGDRSSLGLSLTYADKFSWVQKDSRVMMAQPEWRYYFSGRVQHSHYVGIGGLLADYDFYNKGKEYHGDAAGVGMTFGYVWNLTTHWNLDFHAGLGCIWYKHKEYKEGQEGDHTNASGHNFLPTDAGITISYIIK